jgi:hypothetical protein
MKKIILLVLLIICGLTNAISSPLIFKVTKEVNSSGLFELGIFDSVKYRQIRIGIKTIDRVENSPITKAVAEVNLSMAKRESVRGKKLLDDGFISASEYNILSEKVRTAQLDNDNAGEMIYPALSVFGLENADAILLTSFDDKGNLNRSFLIDTPPSKISVKVSGKGIYTLYIWGQ